MSNLKPTQAPNLGGADEPSSGIEVPAEELERKREVLATRLRETREYLGMSQQDVADRAGLSRAVVSAIETGRRRVESIELSALADIFSQPISFFLDPAPVGDDVSTDVQHIARAARALTDTDRAELLRFAQFLSSYRGQKPNESVATGGAQDRER